MLHRDRAGLVLRTVGETVMLRRVPSRGVRLSLSERWPRQTRIVVGAMESQTQLIWTEFGDRLRAFIARRVENEADAEDIVQDVFLRIHARLDSLADERKLTSWIYQITRNAIVDYYRERRPTTPLPDAFAAEAPMDDVTKELLPCLRPMLKRLPAQDREALILTDVDGLTQRELADRLGLSLSGAKSRVQRARQKLKHAFMGCCRFEFDRLGGVAEYYPGGDTCRQDRCDCAEQVDTIEEIPNSLRHGTRVRLDGTAVESSVA